MVLSHEHYHSVQSRKYYLFQIHPHVVQLNVTQIAPVATNHAFLDPRKYPNLVRMVPDDSYQVQVSWNKILNVLTQQSDIN